MTEYNQFDTDVIGVGLGPFNLSLAALLADAGPHAPRAVFFEAREQFDWHPGMILPGTTLQVPFLADLVTMAAPRSRFTFLNYLHEHGRLYNFYFYEDFKIFRKEYNQYCRWVCEQLPGLQFGTRVVDIRAIENDDDGSGYRVFYEGPAGAATLTTKQLVLGHGTRPVLPECARPHHGATVWHTAEFQQRRSELSAARRVVVIGSGQSAGECVLEILRNQPQTELHWYTRGQGFLPMEYSKLGLEHFSPDYIDYFYRLPEAARDRIRAGQDLFYKGISSVTIGEIYDTIYENSLDTALPRPRLMGNVELCEMQAKAQGWQLGLRHRIEDRSFVDEADVVILGTGYEYALPDFLNQLRPALAHDAAGRLQIARDYQALRADDSAPSGVFIQNGEIHTHGIGAPDLGLGAYRAALIANQLCGREVYTLRSTNVFQQFGCDTTATVATPQSTGVNH